MREPARVQAAIEVLDAVIPASQTSGPPADRVIADYFKVRRYAGSKDRLAVRDLVYEAIRRCGPVPQSGRAALLRLAQSRPELRDLFDGSAHGPLPIGDNERAADSGTAPLWLEQRLIASGMDEGGLGALLGRAPLDLRVNRLRADRATIELPELGEPLLAPGGLRLPGGTPVDNWAAYREGLIEVQDHGSQWGCIVAAARPGQTIIDLCAGAGGKTLAMAAAMQNEGRIIASDTDRRRLSNLVPRAARAGAKIIETCLLDPGKELAALDEFRGAADMVLVDAPCSSTGTWRRNPEARWRLSPAAIDGFTQQQDRLLDIGMALVKPGGTLTYVVCSLLDQEGATLVEHALTRQPDWRAKVLDLPIGRQRGPGWRLEPPHDATDGFFIAQLCRTC